VTNGPLGHLFVGPAGHAISGRDERRQGASGVCAMVYRFGDCSLDTQRHTLQHAGQPVRLRAKPFLVLRYLLEHRDRTVLKQELYEQV
jgi:DNA-binding response OmpR family regulator